MVFFCYVLNMHHGNMVSDLFTSPLGCYPSILYSFQNHYLFRNLEGRNHTVEKMARSFYGDDDAC